MIGLFLIILFGFFRALYISLVNGFVMWIILKTLESLTLTQSVGYWICVLVAFIPGFIISCIRIYKQVK